MTDPGEYTEATEFALNAIWNERDRQEHRSAEARANGLARRSCADSEMPNGDKLAVLVEEVGEVARELCEALAAKREPSVDRLRAELIHVAAVAVAWTEALS